MLETTGTDRLIRYEVWSAPVGHLRSGVSSLVNQLKSSVENILPHFPIPCFLCWSIDTEPSSLLGTSTTHRQHGQATGVDQTQTTYGLRTGQKLQPTDGRHAERNEAVSWALLVNLLQEKYDLFLKFLNVTSMRLPHLGCVCVCMCVSLCHVYAGACEAQKAASDHPKL